MSSVPFMPLYVADYLGDTQHLTTEQHGAYFLLLMTSWRNGGKLPADDKKLARIAKCTPARWAKISVDVTAFFVLDGDSYVSPRLALELEKASEKQIKRAQSGVLGGRANALKYKKGGEANGSLLLKHSSEPEPYKKNPPTPTGGAAADLDFKPFAKAVSLAADAGMAFDAMADRLHKMQPVVGGKRRSALADVTKALTGAIKRGGKPSAILAAVAAYYALPDTTRDGGQYARGVAVILNADRWTEYAAPAPSPSGGASPVPAAFNGPGALRFGVVRRMGEEFAVAWIDSAVWCADTRTLKARTAYGAQKLKTEIGGWLDANSVKVGAQ